MKKLLLILLLLIPFQTSAKEFKAATLINLQTGYRIVVRSQSEADKAFSIGYTLDKKLLGFTVVTNYAPSLSSSITSSQTEIPVSTTKDKKGVQLATSTLGMKIYLNIEPGGKKEELVVCTGISGDSWTGCTRGLAFSGNSETSVTSYQYPHSQGVSVVMSNIHYVYQNFVDLDSEQNVGGIKNFTSIPTAPTTTPTTQNQLATKKYVDDTSLSGAPAGTEEIPGSWMGATQSQLSNGTATSSYSGIDYGLILQSKYANSVSSSTTTIPITNESGKLDTSFIDQTADYTWSGTNIHSGVNTFSATTTLENGFVPTSTPTIAGQIVGLDSSSKLPAIDGSQLTNITGLLALGNSTITISNTTNATTTATVSLPANTLGTNGAVRIKVLFTDFDLAQNLGTFNFSLIYGTTTIATAYIPQGNSAITNNLGYVEAIIYSTGTTNSQRGFIEGRFSSSVNGTSPTVYHSYAAAYGTSSEDNTSEKTLKINCYYSQANSNSGFTTVGYTIEKL